MPAWHHAAVVERKSGLLARIPSRVRSTIQAAADLEGGSIHRFVVQAAHRQEHEILERETIIRLNREQTKRIFGLLDRPPKPNITWGRAYPQSRRPRRQ